MNSSKLKQSKSTGEIWYIGGRPFKIRYSLEIYDSENTTWHGEFVDNQQEASFKVKELFEDESFVNDNFQEDV